MRLRKTWYSCCDQWNIVQSPIKLTNYESIFSFPVDGFRQNFIKKVELETSILLWGCVNCKECSYPVKISFKTLPRYNYVNNTVVDRADLEKLYCLQILLLDFSPIFSILWVQHTVWQTFLVPSYEWSWKISPQEDFHIHTACFTYQLHDSFWKICSQNSK